MGYIRTLEYENSELKKALSDDVTKVEETMRQYSDALEAMKTLSDEAEENYDKILKSVHGEENKSQLEEKLKDLEKKYNEQSATLKEKETLVKYYYDENVRKREATAKQTKRNLREKVKKMKTDAKDLTSRFEKLMTDRDSLLSDVAIQSQKIAELMQDRRKLQQTSSEWKVKATDSNSKQNEILQKKMMK